MAFVQDLNPWTDTLTAILVQIYSITCTSSNSFSWVDMPVYLLLKLNKPQVFMIIITINDADLTWKYGICSGADSTTLIALKRCKYTCIVFKLFQLSTHAWVLFIELNTLQLFYGHRYQYWCTGLMVYDICSGFESRKKYLYIITCTNLQHYL